MTQDRMMKQWQLEPSSERATEGFVVVGVLLSVRKKWLWKKRVGATCSIDHLF
jgi:hypothetical protein